MPRIKARNPQRHDDPILRDGARRGRLVDRTMAGPDGDNIAVTINLSESPIAWLHARGHVTHRQFQAAEKLRADWERAQLNSRVTMIWDGQPGGGRGGATPDPHQGALAGSTPRWLLRDPACPT